VLDRLLDVGPLAELVPRLDREDRAVARDRELELALVARAVLAVDVEAVLLRSTAAVSTRCS
jgi:hypothetical protein